MDKQRFDSIIDGFDSVRIAVLGDIFLDRIFYIDRGLDEDSVETGLAAYQVRSVNACRGQPVLSRITFIRCASERYTGWPWPETTGKGSTS